MSTGHSRDKVIDGFRGVAVLGVVFGHAIAYRFGPDIQAHEQLRHLTRLAGPFSELGVKLFFVISGYIITTLLVSEEGKSGRVNISAFYMRRIFRILPPFIVYLIAILALESTGRIALPVSDVGIAAVFLCNTSITDCSWFVAHTWSLAVEEQFYLFWPLILTLLHPFLRKAFLVVFMTVGLAAFLILPYQYHSNFSSFPCIAAGALYALSEQVRGFVTRKASSEAWLLVAGTLIVGSMSPLSKWFEAATPLAIVYLIFSSYHIRFVRSILENRIVQFIGFCSYSLYLWQQLFLANTSDYLSPPTLFLLPVAVLASVVLLEQPFMRLGRKVSSTLSTERATVSGVVS